MTVSPAANGDIDARALEGALRATLHAAGEWDAVVKVSDDGNGRLASTATFHAELQACFAGPHSRWNAVGIAVRTGTSHECLLRVDLPEPWCPQDAYPGTPAGKAPLKRMTILLASCEWREDLQSFTALASDALKLPDLAKLHWHYGVNYRAQLDKSPFTLPLDAAGALPLRGALKDDEHGDPTLHLSGRFGKPTNVLDGILKHLTGLDSGNHGGLLQSLAHLGLSQATELAALLDGSKLLDVVTVKQLDVFASISSEARAPKGRLQLTGAVVVPKALVAAGEIPVTLWWPLGSSQLFLKNNEAIKLPMADAKADASLLGQCKRLLAATVIREFVIGVSWNPPGLHRLWLIIGSEPASPGNGAAPAPHAESDGLSISDIWVRLDIAPTPRARVHIELQLCKDVHIELDGWVPDLIFSGSLKQGDTIDVAAMLGMVAKKLGITSNGSQSQFPMPATHETAGIVIDDLAIELDLSQQTYSLHLDISAGKGGWPLDFGGQAVTLQRVGLDLEHSADGSSVLLEGIWSIDLPKDTDLPKDNDEHADAAPAAVAKTFDIRLSAGWDGSGWTISGESVGSGELPIGHLIEHLGQRFSADPQHGWTCPEALKSLRASNLSLVIQRHEGGTDLRLHCETEWTFNGGSGARLALTIRKDSSGLFFDGLLEIGDSRFEVRFAKGDARSPVVAAFYMHKGAADVSLGDLFSVVITDPQILSTLHDVKVDLTEALIAATGGKYLVAFLVNAKLSVGKLPLVGAALPDDFSIGFENVDVLVASDELKPDDLKCLEKLLPKMELLEAIKAANKKEEPLKKGFNATAQLTFGGVQQPIDSSSARQAQASDKRNEETRTDTAAQAGSGAGAGRGTGTGAGAGIGAGADAAAAAAAAAAKPKESPPTWIPVHRTFGPVHLERIGVQLAGKDAVLALDAALSIAGLTVSFDALTLRTPLGPFAPKFSLRGLGIDFHNDAVEIGGAFLERGPDSYGGAAVIRFKQLAISALGLYEQVDGHTSMCIYAVLDYPIGGPPFFFVTGLAAAFGYSRKLNPPAIEDVATFPLISFAQRAAGATPDLENDLRALSTAIPPAIGECFLGVGVRFTSFKIAESFALLTCSFGSATEFHLLGVSNVTAPPGLTGTPAAKLELLLKGSFLPDAGFLGIQAQLTPASYLLSQSCHLSGGFAFFSWFGDSPHHGDFVLSVGGYHPAFRKPAHYPDVPRLALNWKVDDSLTVKGQTYFALTPSALMAGGALEANWVSDCVRAWFKFAADMLLEWKPYHYRASASVEIGVELTFELCGTHHLSVEVGAALSVWGPEFSGRAIIDLTVISVQVAFGPTATEVIESVSWKAFRSFLPDQVCSIALAGGLSAANGAPGKTSQPATVDPYHLAVVVDSALPVHETVLCESDPRTTTATEKEIGGNPHTPFVLRPMSIGSDGFLSKQRIFVSHKPHSGSDPELNVSDRFSFAPIKKNVPRALWGGKPAPDDDPAIVRNVLTGWRLTPQDAPDGTNAACNISLGPDAVDFTTGWLAPPTDRHEPKPTTDVSMRIWPRHQPPLQAGTYRIYVEQQINTRQADGKLPTKEEIFSDAGNRFAEERTFIVGGDRFALAPTDVHAVFPPAGSEGDYSHVLPHVVLSRSTLPWEWSACRGEEHPASPPWLALLVLHESEFTGPTTVKLSELPSAQNQPLTEEEGKRPVSVIDVDEAILQLIAPDTRELSLLTHVRGTSKSGEPNGDCRAVIVSKRWPRRDAVNSVHLVSLEGCYGPRTGDQVATLNVPEATKSVRLVCLHSWKFACKSASDSLTARLAAISQTATRIQTTLHEGGESRSLSDTRATDRTSTPPQGLAGYRGPLTATDEPAPERSRAIAHELGRLLALQSAGVAGGLKQWKHTYLQSTARSDAPALHVSPLHDDPVHAKPPPFSTEIMQWLKDRTLLQGLPFHYLIPHERMLPAESMRFFKIDPSWIEAMLAGALSLGTTGTKRIDVDMTGLLEALRTMQPPQQSRSTSGLLLRSRIVSGWPGLKPVALDAAGNEIEPLSSARLSPNLLLCLFDGVYPGVRIRNPPTMLHFEINASPEGENGAARLIDLRHQQADASSASLAASLLAQKYKSGKIPR